jgi:CubicO group peptidase (beta-lactamase class C family)
MKPAAQRGIDVTMAAEAGINPERLARAFGLLEHWVDTDVLPGAAALVSRGGKIAGEAYLGRSNRARNLPVTAEIIWSLASVTKPFTATAVMLLVERGQLSLDEPLHRLLPEFLDAPPTAFDRRLVTLRHALAHCSGLPGFSPDNFALCQAHRPLEDFVVSFGRQPLFFEPGTAHLYSNPGILLAAEVVGRARAGSLGVRVDRPQVRRYHDFVHQDILAPLGMTASSLVPPEDWSDRIAIVERTGQEGLDWELGNSPYFRSLGIPWGGMYSRPRDLARFVDLFLPQARGRPRAGLLANSEEALGPLLSSAAAEAMSAVQFAPPDVSPSIAPELRDIALRDRPLPAVPWGIGWEIKGGKRPFYSGELTSASTYGHLGATGTMVWADPESDVVCILLTNRTLASGWTSTERPRQALFSNAVMASLR